MPDDDQGKKTKEGVVTGDPKPIDFDKWLTEQDTKVRSAYEVNVAGLKSALQKERETIATAKAERDAQEAKAREAADKALEGQKEFEKLAEERAKRLTQLEPEYAKLKVDFEQMQKDLKRRDEVLGKHLEAQMKTLNLPKSVATLLDRMDVVERLDWIADNGKELAKTKPSSIPATPDDEGVPRTSSDEERRKNTLSSGAVFR